MQHTDPGLSRVQIMARRRNLQSPVDGYTSCMSHAWAAGSTRQWRRIRRAVLDRDRWICQLCHKPIDPVRRNPDPMSAQVHHVHGKAYGDDPAHLQAAHRLCNQKAGDPTRAPDPAPRPVTAW